MRNIASLDAIALQEKNPDGDSCAVISSVKIVAGANNEMGLRDSRRVILKRCRATISWVLLVHEPAVCRLTYDRQQLINAFMSIRLAVHRRFKPRPVRPNSPAHPSHPADQTRHPSAATRRARHASRSSLLLFLFSARKCVACTRVYMYVAYALRGSYPKFCAATAEAPLYIRIKQPCRLRPVGIMY